jgi:hypothetical protein
VTIKVKESMRKRPATPSYLGFGRRIPWLLTRPTTRKEPGALVTPFTSESDPCPVLLMISVTMHGTDSKRERTRRGGSVWSAPRSPIVREAD